MGTADIHAWCFDHGRAHTFKGAPDVRRTVLGLCERLGWTVTPAG
ncbi:hypothetical protein [Streptomyces sp. NPDC006510]